MEVKTAERGTERPAALDAKTACEAFQPTAAAHPDRAAIRTEGRRVQLHLGRVRRAGRAIAAGLAALGVEHGRHGRADAHQPARVPFRGRRAPCTSARRRSRSTTPTRRSRSSTWSATPAARVVITEQAVRWTRSSPSRDGADALEHVVVVDGDAADGRISLDELIAGRRRGLRLRGRLAGGGARRPADADLHLGHDRSAQGRADHARQHLRDGSLLRRDDRVPRRRADRLLPADGARRRAQRAATTCRCCCGFTVTCCPDPREVIALPARGAADLVLRRAADLGEAQGRPRADARRRLPTGAARADAGGARRRRSRRCGSSRRGEEVPAGARGERREGRRGGVLEAPQRTSASTSSRRATSAPRRRPRR